MTRYTMDNHLPTLVIPTPLCSHCGQSVEMDSGSAWCPRCRVQWNEIDDGEISDPAVDYEDSAGDASVVCEAPYRGVPVADHVIGEEVTVYEDPAPCILPSGHDSDHIHPRSWTTVTS